MRICDNCISGSYGLDCNNGEETLYCNHDMYEYDVDPSFCCDDHEFIEGMEDSYLLKKILRSDNPSLLIKENRDYMYGLIPELKVCDGFSQCNDYHLYDVLEHILKVVDNVDNNYILRIAALFHDVGKPISFSKDKDGVGHFYGHWNESIKIFDKYKDLFGLSEEEVLLINNLIYYHDLGITESNADLFRRIFKDNISMLLSLKRADILAQNSKYQDRLNDLSLKRKILRRTCREVL